MYKVHGVRQQGDDFQAFTAPVEASNEEEAVEKFLDQVEDPDEFSNLDAERDI